jgi:GNAT superfamily N-acetyltransferase
MFLIHTQIEGRLMTGPMPEPITIESWDSSHPDWGQLLGLASETGQLDWLNFKAEWHQGEHVLVALAVQEVIGFLRFVVQAIGPDSGCPPVRLQGEVLREAKVIAFAVQESHQRRGIGRALQERLVAEARAMGLYQVRSHSIGENTANHQLKLSLGFGVHPIVRGEDDSGAYFILPLGNPLGSSDT